MSRHRKVKALDYEEGRSGVVKSPAEPNTILDTNTIEFHPQLIPEYDDLYGDYDDDDFDEGAFEAQYLETGIDLKLNESSNSTTTLDKQKQQLIGQISEADCQAAVFLESTPSDTIFETGSRVTLCPIEDKCSTQRVNDQDELGTITSDLTRIAIQHLDKYQWQLPLLEMDKKFRDKTYYRHYTDTYISSLRSKLGHFLTDDKLIDNPMKYHIGQEKDDFRRHSRMFELLTDYYQSLGAGFFTFATPSPDEEIVIGCRLGTKGYYL